MHVSVVKKNITLLQKQKTESNIYRFFKRFMNENILVCSEAYFELSKEAGTNNVSMAEKA